MTSPKLRDLGLEPGDLTLVRDAACAVHDEHRYERRLRVLECKEVEEIDPDTGLFRLSAGRALDADSSWEAARVLQFQPGRAESANGSSGRASLVADRARGGDPSRRTSGAVPPFDAGPSRIGDRVPTREPDELREWEAGWQGDIVDVDDVGGSVYVDVALSESEPAPGRFVVRPFEFLAALDTLYAHAAENGLAPALAAALHAAQRGATGAAVDTTCALPGLESLWGHAWSVLWGPPGTGKTYTIGRQVAAQLAQGGERVLVVAPTNRATDGAAISVGRAVRELCPEVLDEGTLVRAGVAADFTRFEAEGLEALLPGDLRKLRRELAALRRSLGAAPPGPDRARISQKIRRLASQLRDASRAALIDPKVRFVATTGFAAIQSLLQGEVASLVRKGGAPFDTVLVDEAGLVSRATTAALSLLARRRFVLVGDPQQLAPVSKISRILPRTKATWLAESGLGHLDLREASRPGIELLETQHRMWPEIRKIVSDYGYEGRLRDGPRVVERTVLGWAELDRALHGEPRGIWYVLDEDTGSITNARAERGPGGKSWVRPAVLPLLSRLFARHPRMRKGPGLYLSPFRAQARLVLEWLGRQGQISEWSASTIHRQQGSEADYVIFDTVHAGSTAWPHREWLRIVNVAMSRAREVVIVLASRREMEEPYLAELTGALAPRIFRRGVWIPVDAKPVHAPSLARRDDPARIGAQLEARKLMRPLLSAEQERLAQLDLDAGPRLVRGVAGSGKTVVLAAWVARALRDLPVGRERIWVIYANRALAGLLQGAVTTEWQNLGETSRLPWERIELLHVGDLIEQLARRHRVSLENTGPYDYDRKARRLLDEVPRHALEPAAQAAFVDEGQDLGPNTLELIAALLPAEPGPNADGSGPQHKPIRIFYDNDQNVYARGTPNWARLGLEMRGRSTILKESFRTTKPIAEYALNVLYRLRDPARDADHRELVELGLLEPTQRNDRPYWNVHFAEADGPPPTFEVFADRPSELAAAATRILDWIQNEGVRPADIRVIANGEDIRHELVKTLRPALRPAAVRVVEQRRAAFPRADDTLVITTAHSYKGYESELVYVAAADRFVTTGGQTLDRPLYVALTRARSLLHITGVTATNPSTQHLLQTLETTSVDLRA